MFKNKLGLILIVVLVIIGATFATVSLTRNDNSTADKSTTSTEKIAVAASFYPLYEFTKQVGGDKVTVSNITPSGVDAHDFEPKNQDILKINQAKLFVYLGADFDPWAQKAATDIKDRSLEISKSFELLEADHDHEGEEEHKDEKKSEENEDHKDEKKDAEKGKELDPHIWLDPVNAKKMVDLIKDKLITIDSANSATYTQNADNYKAKLTSLDQEFKTGLASCQKNTMIVSHNAFSYLASRYNLKSESISGLEPNDEPTVAEITEIVEIIKKEKLTTVFYENQLNQDLAKTIANEAGATPIVIYAIESQVDGKNYIDLMQENLKAMRQGLQCS